MSDIHCTDEMKSYLQLVDMIVFDMDGVLIDTGKSFIATIPVTAKYYIKEMLKLDTDVSWITEADAMRFKQYSGFNNDWDLTAGLVRYLLYSYKMKDAALSLNSFLDTVAENGKGLDGIESVLKEQVDSDTFDWIYTESDYRRIQKTFQEFYAGEEYCEQLYGFAPEFLEGRGTVKSEIILLDKTLVDRWNGKVGILTGRMRNETELGLEMVGLTNLNPDFVEVTDHVLPDKPHPAKMERILDRADSRHALFLGDSIDDFLTTYNFNNLGKDRQLRFGLVSSDPSNYPEKAGEFAASSVNDLLEFVLWIQGK